VIRGFQGAAIHVQSSGDTIAGNFLGTDFSGTVAGPGNQFGLLIDGGSNNVVGGTAGSLANTIVAKTVAGVEINGAAARANLVEGNFIGTNVAGANQGNISNGVEVRLNASNNTIGGTGGSGNLIGFNSTGIVLNSNHNSVLGNLIGTDAASPRDNIANVVGVSVSGTGNTVGGTVASTFGFNTTGVLISSAGTGDLVSNNFIGTDSAGDNLSAGTA